MLRMPRSRGRSINVPKPDTNSTELIKLSRLSKRRVSLTQTLITQNRSFKPSLTRLNSLLAVQADGSEVLTVEGLEKDGKMHPLQDGFWEEHGLQCGHCTPGMIMASYQLLQRHPNPTDEQIRHGLEGNLCWQRTNVL